MTDRTPEEIATKARSSFSLLERAKGRSLITDDVTVYLDEVTGKKLGGVEPRTRVIRGIEVPDGERRWGVVGQIANLADENQNGEHDAKIAELVAKAEIYRAELDKSKVVITLQALPTLITDAANLATRRHLGLDDEQAIPADKEKAFNRRQSAEIISRAVVSIVDVDGNHGALPDVDEAAEWPGYFPPSEYRKIARKISELQFETVIAEQATDNADF